MNTVLQLTTNRQVKEYVKSGKATFTLLSEKTGVRRTYQLTKTPDKTAFFVSYLSQDMRYVYMGVLIDKSYRFIPKVEFVGSQSTAFVAFDFFVRSVIRGLSDDLPKGLKVIASTKCCRCGRELTTPESIAAGIDPECIFIM